MPLQACPASRASPKFRIPRDPGQAVTNRAKDFVMKVTLDEVALQTHSMTYWIDHGD